MLERAELGHGRECTGRVLGSVSAVEVDSDDAQHIPPAGLVAQAIGEEPLRIITANEHLDAVPERVACKESGADGVEEHGARRLLYGVTSAQNAHTFDVPEFPLLFN